MRFTNKDVVMIYDTDYQGVAHYSSYYRFVTNALFAMKEKLFKDLDAKYKNLWFVIAESKAEYKKPLKFGDKIDVVIEPQLLGKKSVRYNFSIYRGKELTTNGYITQVSIDKRTWKSLEIPGPLAKKIGMKEIIL